MKFCEDKILYLKNLEEYYKAFTFDAQTSGGLLISMNKDDAKEYIKKLKILVLVMPKLLEKLFLKFLKSI